MTRFKIELPSFGGDDHMIDEPEEPAFVWGQPLDEDAAYEKVAQERLDRGEK